MMQSAIDPSVGSSIDASTRSAAPSYVCRRGLLSRELTFRLDPEAIRWTDGRREERIAFGNIVEVCLCRRRLRGTADVIRRIGWTIHLRDRSGARLAISPFHCAAFGRWEDRSPAYRPFADQLLGRIRAVRPELPFDRRQHWRLSLGGATKRASQMLAGRPLVWLLALLGCIGRNRASTLCARAMRTIGPRLRGHRVARANLVAAFPHAPAAHVDRILDGMWDNLGRVCAEYAYLDRLWDPGTSEGSQPRLTFVPGTLERIAGMRADGKPALMFTAHLANWEVAGLAAAALKLDLAVLFRPPDIGAAAQAIIATRRRTMGTIIAANQGAATRIRGMLARGGKVGMLVDQHSAQGVAATFFGRRCRVNPTLARFARLFDCPIHGARVIRLPNGTFRCELTPAIDAPRDASGRIDVVATMQEVTSMVEGWIREHPEQWTWYHRRWR